MKKKKKNLYGILVEVPEVLTQFQIHLEILQKEQELQLAPQAILGRS